MDLAANHRKLWRPYTTTKPLYHITTQKNWALIQSSDFLEPRDCKSRRWRGLQAVFLSDFEDMTSQDDLPKVIKHIRKKGGELVLLAIVTQSRLYECLDPKRKYQRISTEPLPSSCVVEAKPFKLNDLARV